MKKRFCRLILIMLMTAIIAVAETLSANIAQQKQLLKDKSLPDSLRFKTIFSLSKAYMEVNFDSSLAYAFEALKIAEKNQDYSQLIHSYHHISNIFSQFDDRYNALEYDKKSLKLALNNRDTLLAVKSYESIVNNYLWRAGQMDQAKKNLDMMRPFVKNLGDKKKLASFFHYYGIYYLMVKDYASAEKYYKKALVQFKKINDKNNIANILNNLGDLKERTGDLKKALDYNQQALKINQSIDDNYSIFINRYNIASIHMKLGNDKKFHQIMEEELDLAKKRNTENYIKMIHNLYHKYYEDRGNYKKSLAHYRKYIQYKESISNNDKSYQIKKLEQKHFLEKAADERKIYELKLQNKTATLSYLTMIFILSIFVFASLIIYFFKKKKIEELQIKELQTKSELLALQYKLNPHFLFNSLNSLSQLVIKKSRYAEEMVQNLSDLLRYTLTFANKNLVSLEDEINSVAQYLDMEKIRFRDRLTYNIDCDSHLLSQKIPPMIILPLVENSIKHGIANILKNGKISITIQEINNYLTIIVKDNGPQAVGKQVKLSDSTGFGHQSIIDRLKITYAGDFKFEKKKESTQYIVKIAIPLKLKVTS